ncbi:ComF family protein [Marinobacter lacisalsi]|uniref:ComF family protein n=1 Tax=Marinobacter lacisalsi TaxID=475979 RepID=A0ABV8QFA3_9GAMM
MIKPRSLLSTGFRNLVNRFGHWREPIAASTSRRAHQLLPDLCVTCLAPDAVDGLCHGCRQDLPRNTMPCYRCGLPLALAAPADSLVCGECLKRPPAFTHAFIPWCYQFPVDRMIGQYKYRGQRHFVRPLLAGFGALAQQRMEEDPDQRPQLLVPAPMHRKRQRKRVFNQAEDIAEALSLATGIPWSAELLQRKRATPAQSGLDRRQRLSNLKGVFEVMGEVPAHVALVDDVVTTGATARTLATLLQQHGAQTVEIWALARTPSGQSFPHLTGNGQTGGQPG